MKPKLILLVCEKNGERDLYAIDVIGITSDRYISAVLDADNGLKPQPLPSGARITLHFERDIETDGRGEPLSWVAPIELSNATSHVMHVDNAEDRLEGYLHQLTKHIDTMIVLYWT